MKCLSNFNIYVIEEFANDCLFRFEQNLYSKTILIFKKECEPMRKILVDFWSENSSFFKDFIHNILNDIVFVPLIIAFLIIIRRQITRLFKAVKHCKNFLLLKIKKQKKIIFYGRTELIKNICKTHDKGKNNKCLVIYGNGGTGKTTIAKYIATHFCLKRNIEIIERGRIPQNVQKNTMYFFDYIYESEEAIFDFYNNLTPKSHITVVLLEREFVISNLISNKITVTKSFDLNSTDYSLSITDLTNILHDNVAYDYIPSDKLYKANNINYSLEVLHKYAELIVQKFDRKYCRPIFAVILAKLFKFAPNFNINNVNDIDNLFNEYWHMTMSRDKYSKLLSLANSAQTDLINELERNSKLLILLCSVANLSIKVSFPIKQSNIEIYSENEKIHCPDLIEYIYNKLEKFSVYSFKFFFSRNHENIEDGIFSVNKLEYDLLIAWLFVSCMEESQNQNLELKKMFLTFNSAETDGTKKLMINTHSFLLRAADENKEYFHKIIKWLDENITEEAINILEKIKIYINCIVFSKHDDSAEIYYNKFLKLIDVIDENGGISSYKDAIKHKIKEFDDIPDNNRKSYLQKIDDAISKEKQMTK